MAVSDWDIMHTGMHFYLSKIIDCTRNSAWSGKVELLQTFCMQRGGG